MFSMASTSGLKVQKNKDNFSQIKKLMNVEDENLKKMMTEYRVTKKSFKNEKRECLSYKKSVQRDERHLSSTKSQIEECLAVLGRLKKMESKGVESLKKSNELLSKCVERVEKSKNNVEKLKKKLETHKKNLNFYKFRSNLSHIEPEQCNLWFLESGACPICAYVKPITVLLNCKHKLCTDCLKSIKSRCNPVCPFCRAGITQFQAFDVDAMKFYTEKDNIPDTTPPPTSDNEDLSSVDGDDMVFGHDGEETSDRPIEVDVVEATQGNVDDAPVINNVHISKNF